MTELVKAALAFAKQNDAEIVEAYPINPEASKNPDDQSYTGIRSVFERLGFVEVIRRSDIRTIMRYSFTDLPQR